MVNYGSDAGNSLYSSARSRGRRNQLWSALTGRSRSLLSLAEVGAACRVDSRRHAGLQTVPMDTLESAMIDGASRLERIRYVVIPHLMPLVTFVALIQLMDNFRVFEPIVGFSASANATSLSWIIFNDLRGQDSQLFGSAAATSMLTIIGVVVLLTPVLIRTWRDFNRKTV